MKEQLEQLKKDFQAALGQLTDLSALEDLEQEYFGRKSGKVTLIMKGLKDLSATERKKIGQAANKIKKSIEAMVTRKHVGLEKEQMVSLIDSERIDVTQPSLKKRARGHLHPNTIVKREMEAVARSMGFIIEDGPELESDYYVFESLNIPKDHPARDSQDTFYIKDHPNWCMRSHVSNMQVRMMRKHGVPLRVAYPGRVFRNEATDASHEHTFYQFEALVIDKDVTIGHLVGIIRELLHGIYKREVEVRLRPGYFPFVEPGFEMDMSCLICEGKGCSVCKHTGWVEMLGCGLVHPKVIETAGYNPDEYNGLAFGMGLTRLVMMKYGIEDIRHLMAGDIRFLKQF